jgi:hypothetical protein
MDSHFCDFPVSARSRPSSVSLPKARSAWGSPHPIRGIDVMEIFLAQPRRSRNSPELWAGTRRVGGFRQRNVVRLDQKQRSSCHQSWSLKDETELVTDRRSSGSARSSVSKSIRVDQTAKVFKSRRAPLPLPWKSTYLRKVSPLISAGLRAPRTHESL